jgi:Protein of unknown function (DUF1376)
MTEILDATSISSLPLEIERLRRSKTWRRCRSEPFLAFYCINAWCAAMHGIPAGSLEDDDESLCDLCVCTPLEWPRIRPMVFHGWQKREDGRLYHPVVERKAGEALRSDDLRAPKPRQRADIGAPAVASASIIEHFEAWWTEYPRKIAKGAARTAYARALNKTGAEVLLDAAKRFAGTVTLKDIHFIPHPATWLNQERWIDGKTSKEPICAEISTTKDIGWNGKAVELAMAIGGSPVFREWFGGATLSPDLSAIIFQKSFKRDWVASHFMPQIRRVIGECSLVVASERPAP